MRREEELNTLFDAAISGHEFVVNLQPKVNIKDGTIGGAEALVRWIHPQQGMIYPSEFIPCLRKMARSAGWTCISSRKHAGPCRRVCAKENRFTAYPSTFRASTLAMRIFWMRMMKLQAAMAYRETSWNWS